MSKKMVNDESAIVAIAGRNGVSLAQSDLDETQSEIFRGQLREGCGIGLLAAAVTLLVGGVVLFRRKAVPAGVADSTDPSIQIAAHSEVGPRSSAAEIRDKKSIKKPALAILGVFLVSWGVGYFLIAQSDMHPAPADQEIPGVGAPEQAKSLPPEVKKPLWSYDTLHMKAGSQTEEIGCLQSDEKVHLKDPYQDAYTELCFRSDSAVFLRLLGDGQILSGEYYHAIIRVNDGPPRSYSIQEPSDHSSNLVFISPAGPLIAAGKAGKQILVELTYYQASSQTSTFTPPSPLVLK